MNNKIWISLWILLGSHLVAFGQNLPVSLGTSKSLHQRLTMVSIAKTTSVDLAISNTKSLSGKINFKKSDGNEALLVGEVSGVKDASFYLKSNAKSLEGHIIIKSTKKAYKYFSDAGNAFVQEVDINSLICIEYDNVPAPQTNSIAPKATSIAPALLNLQSLPGAAGCVMLDFDGYYMAAGNYWNNGQPINAAHSNMSDADVQEHWELVAEDYRPFNLNITTNEGVFNSYPRNRRMRVVITPTNTAAPGAGGVAYIGSFNWDNDVPCWVFMTSGKAGGDASSHEIGHTFDLGHDGRTNQDEYFVGIDGTSWAPIMGAGYYRPIVQWSRGEYNNANNLQDDVATIASGKFGLGYRGDDYSDNTAGAANLDYNGGGAINQKYGVIASEADYDFFKFTTGGGNVVINANTVGRHANLHLLMRLYNSSGGEIGTYWNGDPFATNASMNVNLAAGTYYVGVDGNGAGDRGYGGYSSYGSIGSYWITGNIPPGGGVNPSSDVVTVFKDCNYTGFSGGLTIGDYNMSRLQSLGVINDDISSMRVAQGYKVILYQDDNFTGGAIEITSDVSCFSAEWNDKVTSVRVIANGSTNLQGSYFLQNRNSGLFMDISGGEGNLSDGAKIQQWNTAATNNQLFDFTHLGNGLYKITVRHSNKSLDINSFSKDNGAKVEQYPYNATVNQQFIVVSTGDGFFKIIPRHSGKVVEVAGASMALEAAVQQWDNNNQTCGMWKLVGASSGIVTTYKDCNYAGFSGGFGLGDYTLYQMGAKGVRDDDLSSLKITEGYKAVLYQDNNFGGGTTEITADNTCLNATWNDKVTSLRVRTNGTPITGTYYLQNRMSGLMMDVSGIAMNDGASIMQSALNGGANQQFEFTHLGDGNHKILAVHSGKSLDVVAGNKAEGTVVQQWGYVNNAHQRFIMVPTGDGFYKIIAEHSGMVLEVSTNNAGENIHQWWNAGQQNSHWKLVPVTVQNGNGDGLTGNYFNGMNFETPVFSRKDVVVNADWGGGSPNAAVNVEGFSARWSGQVQPKYSGEYTFYINSDNGRRLWINNTLIIDKWVDDWGVEYSGKITLAANQKYDIKMEYFENYGGANVKLEWSHASQTKEVIPTSQLYSNALPTVSITSPSNNQTFSAPASVTINANAADNGSIAKVEFYNGATKLGEDNSSPYSFNWSNVAAGTYSLTTRATDNQGGITASSAVSITVNNVVVTNQPPTVSLTSPSNGQTFNAPASVTISANAADSDGNVSKVEFYNGSTKVGEDASAPYSFSWNGVGAGSYTISAKAIDNSNASRTSSSVSITVNTVSTDACANVAAYSENNGYAAGSVVKNAGRRFECKEWPYSGWCNGASWAYAPGEGAYWTDAWYDRGACNAGRVANDATTLASAVIVSPNPTQDNVQIQVPANGLVSVFNSRGEQVLATREIISAESISLGHLPSGMYMIKLEIENEIITKLVVKQ